MSSFSSKLSQTISPRISHPQDELLSPPTHLSPFPHTTTSIQKLAVDKFIKIIIISNLLPLKGCILNSFHYCLRTGTFSPGGLGGVTLWGIHSHSPPAADQHFSRLWWQKPAKPAAHMENRTQPEALDSNQVGLLSSTQFITQGKSPRGWVVDLLKCSRPSRTKNEVLYFKGLKKKKKNRKNYLLTLKASCFLSHSLKYRIESFGKYWGTSLEEILMLCASGK